ncbi:MAG: hypothetical protein AAGE59_14285 [Cyanobacteria bacterium P01_F01_bin.86]
MWLVDGAGARHWVNRYDIRYESFGPNALPVQLLIVRESLMADG